MTLYPRRNQWLCVDANGRLVAAYSSLAIARRHQPDAAIFGGRLDGLLDATKQLAQEAAERRAAASASRAAVARALLAAGCSHSDVAALLDVSPGAVAHYAAA